MRLSVAPFDLVPEFAFNIATGGDLNTSHHVLLCLEYEGLMGMGEAVPVTMYGQSRAETMAFLESLRGHDWLKTATPFDMQAFWSWMDTVPGQLPAKSALDMAMWDLQGKVLGQPVWRLWGLETSQPFESAYTIGIDSLDEMQRKTELALGRGYTILKLKLGGDTVARDQAILTSLRQCVPADVPFWVDANTGWTFDDFVQLLPVMMDTGVALIEEPFVAGVGANRRCEAKHLAPMPLVADESCHTAADVVAVREQVDGINIKLTKCGGLSKAWPIVHTARACGLQVMLGGFVETSLAVTAMAQLAPVADFLDLDAALLSGNDPAEGMRWAGSRFTLPDVPGLGVCLTEPLGFQ